jgi:hypothetical protein
MFEQIAVSNTKVMGNVISLLPKGGAACLRGASRGMRDAVNRSVNTAVCVPGCPFVNVEIAEVFPDADHLHVRLPTPPDDMRTCLADITTSTPVLLGKIQSLKLFLEAAPEQDYAISSIIAFLSR